MSYRLFIYEYTRGEGTGKLFEVSELAHNIQYTTSLESQPGKFTFTLEKDLSNSLVIKIGSQVIFTSEGKTIFHGKVFTMETDSTDIYRVVAYDSLRYLKNQDSILVDESSTIEDLFKRIMVAYNLNGEVGKWKDNFVLQKLEPHFFANDTLFEILQYYMGLEMERLTRVQYSTSVYRDKLTKVRLYLRCNGDKIEMREVGYDFLFDENGNKRTEFLQIGDESLMTSYNYKVDIDKETYNRLIFIANMESNNSSKGDTNTQVQEKQLMGAIDSGTIISNTDTKLDGTTIGEDTLYKWGVLSKIVEVKEVKASNMLAEYMKLCMEVYGLPNQTLRINSIGHDDVYAGSGFYLHINSLDIDCPVYVVSATHVYDNGNHTMELEVSTNSNMKILI